MAADFLPIEPDGRFSRILCREPRYVAKSPGPTSRLIGETSLPRWRGYLVETAVLFYYFGHVVGMIRGMVCQDALLDEVGNRIV